MGGQKIKQIMKFQAGAHPVIKSANLAAAVMKRKAAAAVMEKTEIANAAVIKEKQANGI